jgi:hypothetical protein
MSSTEQKCLNPACHVLINCATGRKKYCSESCYPSRARKKAPNTSPAQPRVASSPNGTPDLRPGQAFPQRVATRLRTRVTSLTPTSLATTQVTTRRFRRIEWLESHLTLPRKRARSYSAHPHGRPSAPHPSAEPERVGPHHPTTPASIICCPNATQLHPAQPDDAQLRGMEPNPPGKTRDPPATWRSWLPTFQQKLPALRMPNGDHRPRPQRLLQWHGRNDGKT